MPIATAHRLGEQSPHSELDTRATSVFYPVTVTAVALVMFWGCSGSWSVTADRGAERSREPMRGDQLGLESTAVRLTGDASEDGARWRLPAAARHEPAPVAQVRVRPAEVEVVAGGVAQLAAILLDSSGVVLTGRVVRWESSNPAIAAVSATGAVTGRAPGFVRVTATSEGRSGHAEAMVVGAAAPSAGATVTRSTDRLPRGEGWQPRTRSRDLANAGPGYPHEPAGFRPVSERAFRTKAGHRADSSGSEGWAAYEHQEDGFTIARDHTAPKSPSEVGQMRYVTGFRDGSSPGQASKELPEHSGRLYLSFWIKLSANWQPHASGVNKIFHIWLGEPARNKVFLSFYGHDPRALRFTVHTQATPEGARNYTQNIGAGLLTRAGAWQRYELVLVVNTPGKANGEAHAWVDGRKVLAYKHLRLVAAGEPTALHDVQWSPTWGGNSADVVRETMHMWLDHAYLSAAPH